MYVHQGIYLEIVTLSFICRVSSGMAVSIYSNFVKKTLSWQFDNDCHFVTTIFLTKTTTKWHFFWLFLAKIVVILKSKHLAALHHYLLIFEQYSNKLTFRKSKDKSKHKFSQRCQCHHWAFFGFQLPHFHTVSNIEFQSFAIVIVITIVTWQRLSIVKCHNNVVTMETLIVSRIIPIK